MTRNFIFCIVVGLGCVQTRLYLSTLGHAPKLLTWPTTTSGQQLAYMVSRYNILIQWSDNDQYFAASLPKFWPYAHTHIRMETLMRRH